MYVSMKFPIQDYKSSRSSRLVISSYSSLGDLKAIEMSLTTQKPPVWHISLFAKLQEICLFVLWMGLDNFLSLGGHVLVPFLFHKMTSLHHPSFQRNDFSTCTTTKYCHL